MSPQSWVQAHWQRCVPWALIAILFFIGDSMAERELPGLLLVTYGCVSVALARYALWRLRRGPVAPRSVVLAVFCAGWIGFGFLLSSIGIYLHPFWDYVYQRTAVGATIFAAGCALLPELLAGWRWILRLPVRAAPPPSTTPSRWSPAVVLVVTFCAHALLFSQVPGPLLQVDSYVNLWHPGLLNFGHPPHHPPIYPELIKAVAPAEGNPWPGLTAVVLVQHLLVILVALGFERAARLMTGRAWVGCLTGLLIGLDSTWNLYAQSIMSEVPSSALCMFSALCLLEAERREHAVRWLVAAGLLAALATLTRQAMQAWFGVALIWLTLFSALRPRRWACLVICLVSLAPVGLWMTRNYVALERGIVTASLGRNLMYRVVLEMPDLTDPDAPPGDEMERARRIIWEERDAVWAGPWKTLERELGWDDARINRAVVHLYVEQAKRYPGRFAGVTLDSIWKLATSRESIRGGAYPFHNQVLEHCPWKDPPIMPGPEEPSPALDFLERFQPSASVGWLVLAALSPLLAWGAARRASFLALGGFVYFCLLAALVEVPIARYRLPGVPLLYLAGCLSLAGIARLAGLALAKARGQERPEAGGEPAPVAWASGEVSSSDDPASVTKSPSTLVLAEGERSRLQKTAIALAAAPALLEAAVGEVWFVSFVLVLAAQVALALVIARLRGGVRTRFTLLDTGAWLFLCVGSTVVTLLASPEPFWTATNSPGRRTLLAVLGLALAVAVAILLFLPTQPESAEESPQEPAEGPPLESRGDLGPEPAQDSPAGVEVPEPAEPTAEASESETTEQASEPGTSASARENQES